MKAKVCISILFLLLFVVGIYASEQIPVAVSPGNDAGIAVVGEVCPTFSWTAVEGSAAYRVEVFNAIGNTELAFEDIAAMSYPVLTKEILGAATSWTPSSDQRLVHDGIYVWYVQAIDAYGAGAWSKGEIFKVDVGLSFSPIEETVIKTLEEHGVDNNIIDEVIRNVNNNQSLLQRVVHLLSLYQFRGWRVAITLSMANLPDYSPLNARVMEMAFITHI